MPFNGHLYCCSRFEVYLFPTAKEGRIVPLFTLGSIYSINANGVEQMRMTETNNLNQT